MFVSKEMIKNIKNLPTIGNEGNQGKCYTDGTYVYKFYRTSEIDFLAGLGQKSEYIAFPIEEFRDENNVLVGYKSNIMPGDQFYKGMEPDTRLEDILKAYYLIKEEVKNFEQFQMIDLCYINVLFDKKRFYIIDTDRWELNYNCIRNITNLNFSINEGIINSLSDQFHRVLFDMKKYPVDGTIEIMEKMYVKKYGEIPTTIGEFRRK